MIKQLKNQRWHLTVLQQRKIGMLKCLDHMEKINRDLEGTMFPIRCKNSRELYARELRTINEDIRTINRQINQLSRYGQ